MKRPHGRRAGTALVELALALPVLSGLLLGIADIGYLYNHQLVLTNAAREGARLGALGKSEAEIQQAVLDYMSASGYQPLPAANQVNVLLTSDSARVGLASSVPTLFGSCGTALTLHATTEMRLQ